MEGLRTQLLVAVLATVAVISAQDPLPAKPKDVPKAAAKVALRIRCSDTILETAQLVSEEYSKANGNPGASVAGGGSGAALASLADGSADVAFTTRQPTAEELTAIRAKGFEPLELVIGYETLAIVVHKDNPIASLTLTQLADLWGDKGPTTRWSQLGVTLPSAKDAAVQLVGRQANSASYQHFKSTVLGPRGNGRLGVLDLNGDSDIAKCVAKTPNAIGYCPAAYAIGNNLKVVPIAAKAEGTPVVPSTGTGYPLRRAIYAYFHDEPTGEVKRFATWIKKADSVKASGLTPP